MGRPNKGLLHLETMTGNSEAKRRVRVILATLNGEMTVKAACAELGIHATQFGNLRTKMLQGAIDAMEPQAIGRPMLSAPEPANVDELEQEIVDLELENTMLQAKLEVNEALHAARRSKSPGGDESPPAKRARRPRRELP
jgi:transposase-like protein